LERIFGLPAITAFVVFGLPALITLILMVWAVRFKVEDRP